MNEKIRKILNSNKFMFAVFFLIILIAFFFTPYWQGFLFKKDALTYLTLFIIVLGFAFIKGKKKIPKEGEERIDDE